MAWFVAFTPGLRRGRRRRRRPTGERPGRPGVLVGGGHQWFDASSPWAFRAEDR